MRFWTSSGTMFFLPQAAEDARSDVERRAQWDEAIAWCTETFGAPASDGTRPYDSFGWSFFGFHPRDPDGKEEPPLSGIHFESRHEAEAFSERFSDKGTDDVRRSSALRKGIIEQISETGAGTLTSEAWGRIACAVEVEIRRAKSMPSPSESPRATA
jgi:hypothetical protein